MFFTAKREGVHCEKQEGGFQKIFTILRAAFLGRIACGDISRHVT